MKHKDKLISNREIKREKQINALTVIARRAFQNALGYQYNGDRDIYDALGYSKTLYINDYLAKYKRQGIGSAVINRPVNKTWKGAIEIKSIKENEKWDESVEEIFETLKVKKKFIRADKLSSLGRFGVILLGFNDVSNIEELKSEVKAGEGLKLVYLTPYIEGAAEVASWETNASNPRYGFPLTYTINTGTEGTEGEGNVIVVHHSRIIHIAGNTLESEVYGQPELESIYNRLMDLEKIVGGSAEMYWRGARPGMTGEVKEGYKVGSEQLTALEEQMDEYTNNLRRFFMAEGVDVKPLTPSQVTDPMSAVKVQLQEISAAKGIPLRILIGSERGELASSQDQDQYYEMIEMRREEYAEQQIVRAFVDRLIEYKVLEEEAYTVVWTSLYENSDKEKAEVGKIRAAALKDYNTNIAIADTFPPEMFYKFILGLTPEQIEELEQHIKLRGAENMLPDEDELIAKQLEEEAAAEAERIEQEKEEEKK